MGVLTVAGLRMGTGKKGGLVWAEVGLGFGNKAKREYAKSERFVVFLRARVRVARRRSLEVLLLSVPIVELVIRSEREELTSSKKRKGS